MHDEPADLVKELVAGLLPVGHLNVQLQVLHAVYVESRKFTRSKIDGKETNVFLLYIIFNRFITFLAPKNNSSGFED